MLRTKSDRNALNLDIVDGQWALGVNQLICSITRRTKLVVINSPSNPTGWVIPAADQASLLEHCRRTGT